MQNGYFKLVNTADGFGVRLIPPKDGGSAIHILELMKYLDNERVDYNLNALKQAIEQGEDTVVELAKTPCPVCNENYVITMAEDRMSATARFYAPSESGQRLTFDDFFKDLRGRNIRQGIQMQVLQEHFQSEGIYCTDLVVAQGKEPRQGRDASIEYYFNTDLRARPEILEDGSVDFFNLNVINHCHKGEVLARIIPEDAGDYGSDILGNRIKPREVKRANLRYGKNIALSEDRNSISSMVDGHVALVDGNVFVSNVYEVENVDTATGNIDFVGSVRVNGNVATNFSVRAQGDVVVNGVVEGAYIEAGGNIIIARGMNGMSRGILKAGGNIVAKFLENSTAQADGYISTESILHSNVSAGTEVLVTGKKGFIAGGRVQATERVEVKTLGTLMGAPTVIEVGSDPKLKMQYALVQKEVAEIVASIKSLQPTITNFTEKRAKGVKFSEEQIKYVKNAVQQIEAQKVELEKKNNELKELQELINPAQKAVVVVQGEAYPGATIIISEASMTIKSSYHYCRFEKVDGDVKMLPM